VTLDDDGPVSASRAERFERAATLRAEGRGEEARAVLLELRAAFPDDAQVTLETAYVHDSLGYEEDAVRHYEAALAGELGDDERRGALLGLGSTFRALGRDTDSDRTLREGIERYPDDNALRAFHALTSYSLGRHADAVRSLVEVLLETTADERVTRYRRALLAYADDLDRSWLR